MFRIEPGADVRISSFMIYQEKLTHYPLFPVSSTLRGSEGNRLEVMRYIKCKLTCKKRHTNSDLYLNRASKTFLGKGDFTGLGLVKFTVNVGNYPQLHKGLRTMLHTYTIKLKEKVTPRASMTPHHIVRPLMPKK